MRITRWGEFGILCSLYLARKSDQSAVGAAEIADHHKIPLQYTQQILHRLRKGGVIASTRGAKGGYRLALSPEKTTLKDILFASEGHTFEITCDNDPVYGLCSTTDTVCGLKAVWGDLKAAIDQILEKKTLAQLLITEPEASQKLVPGPKRATPVAPLGN